MAFSGGQIAPSTAWCLWCMWVAQDRLPAARRGGAAETLQTTSLVSEAYLRLIDSSRVRFSPARISSPSRRRRSLHLVDRARERRQSLQRWGPSTCRSTRSNGGVGPTRHADGVIAVNSRWKSSGRWIPGWFRSGLRSSSPTLESRRRGTPAGRRLARGQPRRRSRRRAGRAFVGDRSGVGVAFARLKKGVQALLEATGGQRTRPRARRGDAFARGELAVWLSAEEAGAAAWLEQPVALAREETRNGGASRARRPGGHGEIARRNG